MDILAKLGIDWKLFVAQLVNFAILLLVLKRFAYKPMLAFLEERTNRIEKGLKDADIAREKLEESIVREKEILDNARQEARKILEKAEESGRKHMEDSLRKASEDIERMKTGFTLQMETEKNQLMTEARQELADVVILTVEKVLREKINTETDEKLIRKHLNA